MTTGYPAVPVASPRWLLTAILLLAGGAFAQDLDPAAAPDVALASEDLERMGATIREVHIVVDNVFDSSNEKEDKKLYRWANDVHVPTRKNVIEDALLFQAGDAFTARALEESARDLRARGFLAEVHVEPRDYDPIANSVDVEVHVRDSWTLAPGLKFKHSGGASEWGVGMSDKNLFGTGKQLTVSYKSLVDRDETLLSYGDPNVFGSRVRLNALFGTASDGYRRTFGAERPFYSLDARWMLGGSLHDEQRVDTMYDLGERIDEFGHDLKGFTFQGGWSPGFADNRTRRWILGFSSEEDVFHPAEEAADPLLLPENRKLVYPWVGLELIQNDFREMRELNDIGRTEDVAFGRSLFVSVGLADKSFGSDRDATLYRATFHDGWELGGAGRLLLVNASASTRDESAGPQNSIVEANARYYVRNGERRLLSINAGVTASHNLDDDMQVLLGGDNGLRGYPLRYQAGARREIFTVEERFFTDLYPWHLFRVGYAAFLDVGRVSGTDPRATPSLGTLYDLGVGLRLSSPRASGKSVVHIDLAFPLNGDPSVDKVQFLVETKGSF